MHYKLSGLDKAFCKGLSAVLENGGDVMRGLLQPSQGSLRDLPLISKTEVPLVTEKVCRVGLRSALNHRDKAPGSLGALSEGCTSDDLFAEVLYIIPYCFQGSDISVRAVITLRPCVERNAENTLMTGERTKSNKMFYFRLLHFLIQMFL